VRRQTADHLLALTTLWPRQRGQGVSVFGVSESKSESETVGTTGTSWCPSFKFAVVMVEAEVVVVV
jgi:hypothetical protein